jgi:serine/threonine kinase 16
MPFRAPELFDPPVGSELNEKVDVWSLGCTLFAMAYGHSPFEVEGSSVVLAVRNGQYRFPNKDRGYSEGFRELVRFTLEVKPEKRPDIHQVGFGVGSCWITMAQG